MKTAAIGVSVHSGWGAVVTMAGGPGAEEVLDRRRVVIIDSNVAGAAQPFHYAKEMGIRAAEKHLNNCAAQSTRLALAALTCIAAELRERDFMLAGAAILQNSARPLPGLESVLSSHPLIHTAEGEFFREAFRNACQHLKIPIAGIRARDLDDCALKTFGKAAPTVCRRIEGMGRSLGAPWTMDQKTAALAAAIVLAGTHPKGHAARTSVA